MEQMEFSILKAEFLQALSQVQGVVEKKNVMPVLANVLLEANPPLLKISATDLEVAYHVLTQANIKSSGKITVLARKLFDIVKEAAGEEITVKLVDKEKVEITSKQNQCLIMGLPANEFPELPKPEGDFVKIACEGLSEIFQKVSFAMSTDETRYHLNGVYIENTKEGTIFVATDGHRLSLVMSDLKFSEIEKGIIIPRKGVNELRKLLAQEKTIEISVGKRHLTAKTEKQTLFIRLIDGDFPNYKRVIPDETKIQVKIPREELIGALRRVSLLSDEFSKGVKLYFCKDAVLVNTASSDIGEAKEEIVIAYKDKALEISFNAKYLLDVLGAVSENEVTFGFNDKSSPCVMTCEGVKGFRSVIMPMRA